MPNFLRLRIHLTLGESCLMSWIRIPKGSGAKLQPWPSFADFQLLKLMSGVCHCWYWTWVKDAIYCVLRLQLDCMNCFELRVWSRDKRSNAVRMS